MASAPKIPLIAYYPLSSPEIQPGLKCVALPHLSDRGRKHTSAQKWCTAQNAAKFLLLSGNEKFRVDLFPTTQIGQCYTLQSRLNVLTAEGIANESLFSNYNLS